MKDTDFDISVRNLLQDAEAPVRGKVWKGVAAAIAPRHFVVPFWAYAMSGVAVAAAVALGVFLYKPQPQVDLSGAIALVPAQIHTELPEADVMSPLRRQIATSKAASSTAYLEEAKEEAPVAEEIQAETVAREIKEPVRSNGVPKNSTFNEDFEALKRLAMAEEKPHKPSISIKAFGNIQNNNRNAFARSRNYAPILSAPSNATGEHIDEYPEVAFGLPISAGMSASYNFSPRWYLGLGLKYTWLNRTFVGDYYMSDGWKELGRDIDNFQHWIGFPLNLYFDVLSNRYWHFHTFIGGSMELLMDNDFLVHGAGKDFHYRQNSGYPPQFSVGAGLGIEYTFVSNVGIYLDPSLRYYMNSANQPRSIRTVQPLRIDVEAGVRFYF